MAMINPRKGAVIAAVIFGALRVAACSAHSTGGDTAPVSGTGGTAAGGKTASSGGHASAGGNASSAGATGTGDNGGILHIKDASAMRTTDSSCGAVAEVPEQITTYTEASVTDTITTLTPVAI